MPVTVEKINELLAPLLEGTDVFVINIKVKPINNIKVYLDSDSGLSIEKSAKINRGLYHAIEDEQLFPDGDFSLEVSSPGVDEPLLQFRQYKKNIGRKVLITTLEGAEKLGILKDANEERVVLEMQIAKKKETSIIEIPVSEIKQTIVQIIF